MRTLYGASCVDGMDRIRYIVGWQGGVMKRLTAIFFQTEAGEQPVRKWLLELDDLGKSTNRQIVGRDIATVEFGWPVGMPTCRHLREGVSEVRSTIRKGKVEARVYFGIDGGLMVLLHAQDGKGQQSEAIDKAVKRWTAYKRQKQETKDV